MKNLLLILFVFIGMTLYSQDNELIVGKYINFRKSKFIYHDISGQKLNMSGSWVIESIMVDENKNILSITIINPLNKDVIELIYKDIENAIKDEKIMITK